MATMTIKHPTIPTSDGLSMLCGYATIGIMLVGTAIAWTNYQSKLEIESLKAHIQHNERVLKQLMTDYQKRNSVRYLKTMEQYNDTNSILLENIQRVVQMLQDDKQRGVSYSDTFSPIKPPEIIEPDKLSPKSDIDDNDDELLNECYDAIPLNNIKKHTKLTWLYFS